MAKARTISSRDSTAEAEVRWGRAISLTSSGPHSNPVGAQNPRLKALAERDILRFRMLPLFFLFISWWKLLLMGVAIVHFIRRRPDTYWIFIIIFLGWIGALIYIVVEVIPDASLLRGSFQAFPRRRRIRELEMAIRDNPSAGNFLELGLLYLDEEEFFACPGVL